MKYKKYKVGQRMRVVDKKHAPKANMQACNITKLYGKVVTITRDDIVYQIKEDDEKWAWSDNDFSGPTIINDLIKLIEE